MSVHITTAVRYVVFSAVGSDVRTVGRSIVIDGPHNGPYGNQCFMCFMKIGLSFLPLATM